MLLSLQLRSFGPAWLLRIECACGHHTARCPADLSPSDVPGRYAHPITLAQLLERMRCSGCRAPAQTVILSGPEAASPFVIRGSNPPGMTLGSRGDS